MVNTKGQICRSAWEEYLKDENECELVVEREGDFYRIKGFDVLNLKATLYCGQAFRWKEVNGFDTGVVRGKLFRLRQDGDSLLVCDDCAQADLDVLVNYLQINRRHRIIEDCLSSMDDVMTRAVSYSPGLRLVDQEPWECLISYILSANNSIPLITRAIEKISARWGCPIESREGVFYSFPTPEQLADATEEELYDCKTGFRAKYVLGALSGVLSGEIDLEEIKTMDYPLAKESLMKIKGVGQKVSDCGLLFSMGKYDAFPVDIWIDRIVRYFYFDGAEVSKDEIRRWAEEKYGPLSGYAQEYLFAYAREAVPDVLRK